MNSAKRKTRVAVLGGSGMLGAMVVDVLAADPDLSVCATVRQPELRERFGGLYPAVEWRLLDAEADDVRALEAAIDGAAWVVNCIGIIKPYIHDDRANEVERAIRVNALLPHVLGRVATRAGSRILQIATDCVYSGTTGGYGESAAHDALDVYGKTKSLGEAFFDGMHLLRCSIIGPEVHGFVSLLEWFLGRPRGAEVNGFTNHRWNGVTTLHFARLCRAVIAAAPELPRLQHIIPTGSLSKAEMLSCFARSYGRDDLRIHPVQMGPPVDRTLATERPQLNARLWNAAGYSTPPTIEQMVDELSRAACRFREARA